MVDKIESNYYQSLLRLKYSLGREDVFWKWYTDSSCMANPPYQFLSRTVKILR